MARKILNGLDLNNKNLSNVASAASADQVPNLGQVQGLINARSPKDDVIVLTTTNINLSAVPATIDGITMSTGMRFIAAGQTTGSQNGIYDYPGSGSAATRSADADSIAELSGAVVAVQRGTNADKLYLCTNDDTDTLGTTTINFVQTGTGTSYVAGNGLALTGSTFDVGAGTGISVAADSVAVDTSVVVRKYAAACAATTNPQTFNHALNNSDVMVMVREVASGALVEADITITDANNVSVNFGGAPTSAQFRVVVQA